MSRTEAWIEEAVRLRRDFLDPIENPQPQPEPKPWCFVCQSEVCFLDQFSEKGGLRVCF